jgi:S-adenosylmethionine/arginine decarboxylase-like enzyme
MNHQHIIITASDLAAPPRDEVSVYLWLARLVETVGMQVLHGPVAQRCDDAGNEGVTGMVLIKTSHASIHVWDQVEKPFAKIDLYSCKDFGLREVLDAVKEFAPGRVDWLLLDRNAPAAEMLEAGTLQPSPGLPVL